MELEVEKLKTKSGILGLLILSTILTGAFSGVVLAQEEKKPPPEEEPRKDCPTEEACKLWEEFKARYGKPSIVEWDGRTGALKRIRGLNYDTGVGEVRSPEKAMQIAGKFIEDNKALWKVDVEDLKNWRTEYSTRTKRWIVSYQQYYQGIPVENSFVGVTITDKGEIYSASSGFHPNISISTTPAISEDEAVEIAKRAVNVSIVTKLGDVSLTVLPEKSDGEFKYLLVWIVPLQGYRVMDSYKVFVDAQSGEVVKKYSTVVSATGGVGDIIRYNLRLLFVPAALVFLLILVYWWRR